MKTILFRVLLRAYLRGYAAGYADGRRNRATTRSGIVYRDWAASR